jgi:hypothetical protein
VARLVEALRYKPEVCGFEPEKQLLADFIKYF